MSDKVFIDSNIWLYALIQSEADQEKSLKAKASIVNTDNIFISTQIVNEVCINLMRKGNKDAVFIDQFLIHFMATYSVMSQTKDDVLKASSIRGDYHFSYWDSLVVACAIRGDCKILYSEDMQHELIIYKKLQIVNPLL
ncbi:MAG: PIN domain-containing protein [Methylococcaceae bacterium]